MLVMTNSFQNKKHSKNKYLIFWLESKSNINNNKRSKNKTKVMLHVCRRRLPRLLPCPCHLMVSSGCHLPLIHLHSIQTNETGSHPLVRQQLSLTVMKIQIICFDIFIFAAWIINVLTAYDIMRGTIVAAVS